MITAQIKNRLALLRRGQTCCPGCGAGAFAFGTKPRTLDPGPRTLNFSASDVDLYYAIGLPPEKAIEYFRSKGFAYSWNWQDLWQAAQSQAFTVAKAMRMDVLQTIRDEVQTALDSGMTFAEFQKDLEPKLKALGWWGKSEIVDADGVVSSVQLGSPWRLQTIYRTNLQTSLNAGRYQEFMANVDDRPFWQYVAVMDAKTRPTHAAMNGMVFRYDDPFWATHYPPNDWGCRCRVRALSARDVQNRGIVVAGGYGNLSEGTITLNGEEYKVTTYTDPKTGLSMTPGAGWNYNPGAVAWKPDLAKYDPDIARLA